MALKATVLALSLVAAVAHGDPREEARAHFAVGTAAFERGQYAEAEGAFRTAYRLAPFPDLLYNIGRCQEKRGDVAAAIASYDQFLAVTPPSPDRDLLAKHVVELRRSLFAAAPGSSFGVDAHPAAAHGVPIYRRWWLWTGVALLAVGAAIGIAFAATSSPAAPMLDFPALSFTR